MQSGKSIFKEKAIQADFDRSGFVKVTLLDLEQVEKLVNCYEKNKVEHQKTNTLHHTSTDTANTGIIIEEDSLIKEVFVPALNKIMTNYKPLVGCFHIKETGTGSATGIHQDPTFVDDEHYVSANVWVALHDIGSANGNLFFVRGSHRVSNSLRVTPFYPVYYSSFSHKLRDIAVEVPLKAGEAVIFHNATIHGATDNQSSHSRLAATLLVCSKEAQWHIYYNDNSQGKMPIGKYQLDFDTFIEIPKSGKPSPQALRERIEYIFPEISEELFYERIREGSYGIHSFRGWISRRLKMLKK